MDTFMIVALVWLIGTIDSINFFMFMFGLVFLLAGLLGVILGFVDKIKIAAILGGIASTIGFMMIVFFALMPNKDTLKEMAVAYGVVEILKTDEAKEVGKTIGRLTEKTAAVVEKKLDEQLEEK